MKNIYCLLFMLIAVAEGFSQNLVPNPSFEEYSICPNDYYMLPTDWYTCSGNPDYFNECDSTNTFGVPSNYFGYQQAADGRAYCGFHSLSCTTPHPYYKEYLGCQLTSPLLIGVKYYVSFKVNFSGGLGIGIATNNIGLLFSTQSYVDYDPYDLIYGVPTLNFAHVVDTNIITDSVNWTTIKGSIIADSVYQYIVIGIFFDDYNTDTVTINNSYIKRAYYYLDEVCVSTDSLTCNINTFLNDNTISQDKIIVIPNPFNFSTTIFFNSELNIKGFMLYDLFGRDITKSLIMNGIIENNHSMQYTLNKGNLTGGVYILKIITDNNSISTKIIITN